jgi:hypothetical protein
LYISHKHKELAVYFLFVRTLILQGNESIIEIYVHTYIFLLKELLNWEILPETTGDHW